MGARGLHRTERSISPSTRLSPPSLLRSQAAKEVVLAQKPVISDDSGNLDPVLLDKLMRNMASLSSIYHKLPEQFVSRQRLAVQKAAELQVRGGGWGEDEEGLREGNCILPFSISSPHLPPQLQGHQFEEEEPESGEGALTGGATTAVAPAPALAAPPAAPVGDLLDLNDPVPATPAPTAGVEGGLCAYVHEQEGGTTASQTFSLYSSPTPSPSHRPRSLSSPHLFPLQRQQGGWTTCWGAWASRGGRHLPQLPRAPPSRCCWRTRPRACASPAS